MPETSKADTAASHMDFIKANPNLTITDWDCVWETEPVAGHVDELGGCRATTGEVVFRVRFTDIELKERFEAIKEKHK